MKKYLGSIGDLCNFLIMDSYAKKYIKIVDIEDILKFSLRINALCKAYNQADPEHFWDRQSDDESIMIYPEDVKMYYKSEMLRKLQVYSIHLLK